MTQTENSKEPIVLTDLLRAIFAQPLNRVAGFVNNLGIHPNTMTVAGVMGALIASVFLARGEFGWATLCLFIVGPFDALDGAMARLRGKPSPFGALLDSFSDRYIELFLFGGLLWYFHLDNDLLAVMLTYAAAAGSVLVSYARARGEGLGYQVKVGLFTRIERFVILFFAILFASPFWGVAILAVGTNITALHRVWYVYQETQREKSTSDQ